MCEQLHIVFNFFPIRLLCFHSFYFAKSHHFSDNCHFSSTDFFYSIDQQQHSMDLFPCSQLHKKMWTFHLFFTLTILWHDRKQQTANCWFERFLCVFVVIIFGLISNVYGIKFTFDFRYPISANLTIVVENCKFLKSTGRVCVQICSFLL